jgi:hypothetical protein
MEAKFLQFAPDFLEWRDIEFQPNPFADDLGLSPKFRHFSFQFIQQCKRVGHACGIGRHGYPAACWPVQFRFAVRVIWSRVPEL